MSDFDDEPRGRSATGAVIIAVIFLALLGTGVGLVLGSQNKKDDPGKQVAGDATAAPTRPPTAGTSTPKPTNTRTPGNNGTYRPTAKDKCPQQTEEAAGATLAVKRYVRTNRSEAWICSGGGKLYYQGHVIGSSFGGATTDTTIFLSTVALEGDVYIANNGDTNYIVSTESLRIEKNGNVQNDEAVVDLYEG
jgi:hypothetical protein